MKSMRITFGLAFIFFIQLRPAKAQVDSLSFALWVEQPTVVKAPGYFEDFYSGIVDFVECNPANVNVNKLIVRFIDPTADFGGAGNPWVASLTSPFITDLIMKLPNNVPVYILPWVHDWPANPGMTKIETIISTIKDFNDLIDTFDPTKRIKGIVLEGEGAGIAEDVMRFESNLYRKAYGMDYLKVGSTYQGGNLGDPPVFGSYTDNYHLDEAYLQVYNMYDDQAFHADIYVDAFDFQKDGTCQIGGRNVDPHCSSSIYLDALTYPNPAETVFDSNPTSRYTFKHLLTNPKFHWSGYTIPTGGSQYIYPMFSVETNVNATCDYPNTNDPSKCGQINAFGSWKPCDFMDFVDIFSNRVDEMTTFEDPNESFPKSNYAIFQYALIPHSWKHWTLPEFITTGPVSVCDYASIDIQIPSCMYYQLYDVNTGLPYGEVHGITRDDGVYTIDSVGTGTYRIRIFASVLKKETCYAESVGTIEVIQSGPSVSIVANPSTDVCSGNSVTLTASGAAITFDWDKGISNGVPFTPTSSGVYTVTATDGVGCITTGQIAINVESFSVGTDTTFCQSTYQLDANVPIGVTGTWSVQTGGATIGNPLQTTTGVSGLSSGTNEFVWSVQSGACTGETALVTVIVSGTPPVTDAGNDIDICLGDTARLNASPLNAGESGSWTIQPISGTFSNSSDPQSLLIGLANGNHKLTWSVSNSCANAADSLELTVHAPPMVSANANPGTSICDGQQITLTGSGADSYVWNKGIADGIPFSPVSDDTYTVIGTDIFGCSSTDSIEILVGSIVADFSPPAQQCLSNNSFSFINSGNTGSGLNYNWTFNSGQPSSSNFEHPTGISWSSTGNYLVQLIISSGSCADTTSETIEVVGDIVNQPAGPDQSSCEGDPVTLKAMAGMNSYMWSPASLFTDPSQQTVLFSPFVDTDVFLDVIDSYGCHHRDTAKVFVNPCPDTTSPVSSILIPNAFSPNGDGVNDQWWVEGLNPETSFFIQIFNRWGSVVYRSLDPSDFWDGKRNGNEMPIGTYYYVLSMGSKQISGAITLVR